MLNFRHQLLALVDLWSCQRLFKQIVELLVGECAFVPGSARLVGERQNLNAQWAAQPFRAWRGRVRSERADEYEAYSYEAGIKPLIEKAMGVQTFREDRASESEFMTISYWESVEAMSRFTGGDPTRIHHLDRDAEFLVELPDQVQILRILKSHGRTGN